MKSLIYIIINLCVLNYVLSERTKCALYSPSEISVCTDYKLSEEETKNVMTLIVMKVV